MKTPHVRGFLVAALAVCLPACKPAASPQGAEAPAPTGAMPSAQASGPAPVEAEAIRIFGYQCGQYALTATFRGSDRVDISFDGRTLSLTQLVAASGVKYSDGQGIEFWTRGMKDATLTLPGKGTLVCASAGMTG